MDLPQMNYLRFSHSILCECLFEMFNKLNLVETFSLNQEKLKLFLDEVSQNYNQVPYHNFTHAFNIAHKCYSYLTQTSLPNYLEEIDKLTMILAAIGHDVKHPGVANPYLIKSNSPIALTVNDASVLENYHCYTFLNLMQRSEFEFLEKLTPDLK